MSQFSVITRGFSQLEARIERINAQITTNHIRAARSGANVVRRAIRAEAKKIRGSGQVVGTTSRGKPRVRHPLETSIRIWPVGEGFAVGPKTPLAHLVIRGHNPPSGLIMPVDKRALSWNGGQIFAGSSPGGVAKGNPFVSRALDELTRVEAVAAAKTTLFGGPEASDT